MLATKAWTQAITANGTIRQALIDDPSWSWANRLLGDPLLRADDKALGISAADRTRVLERLSASLRDARTRAEIRNRAERKARALRLQAVELRRRDLPDLAVEAEQELTDQMVYIQAFDDPEA